MFRSTQDSFAKLGFVSHGKLLETILSLSQADDTLLLPIKIFNCSSISTAVDFGEISCIASGHSPHDSYQTFTVSSDTRLAGNGSNSSSPTSTVAEEETCFICYTNRGDACLMNCGHGGICLECASTLVTEKSRQCPVCRGEIKRILQINPFFFWLKSNVGVFHSSMGYNVMADRVDVDSEEDFIENIAPESLE